ncbi:HAMP domain-containing sensor histidine kinase [Sulfurovum sp. zt1-1]|uniref:histidine kinase n=2 Tax=Sulfurovum zhangzhouensis TaxID=3019067 RepID=A0ABT7R037_9BACT|nr:HAMP domain-containing sensor histidine kinase [Sulfurovum zhangzhouensis]
MEEEHLSEHIFLEMKNYSFFFEDNRFDIDIVPQTKAHKFYELNFDKDTLYILVPLLEDKENVLKIFYPLRSYKILLQETKQTILWQFLFLTLIAFFISLLFSYYSINPLRKSLTILEEFIKDIIHDLNTPITSILINLKMMDSKDEEVESIAQSAKAISMLHKNLDSYLKDMQFQKNRFSLKEVIDEQTAFFSSIYNYLDWKVDVEDTTIYSDKHAFSRIIYNLLSNACKYNTSHGFVKIIAQEHQLSISNSSHGIHNPSKIFDRFYKESDRGLGIGLHIVDKLCKELGIEKKLEVDHNNTVTIHLYF